MNPETLESLLLDRALGELSAECAELLDAYLARDPAAAARAQGLKETMQVASAAATPLATLAEPLPLPAWRVSPARTRQRFAFQPVLKLAACAAIGLSVGWWARTLSLATPTSSRPVEPPVVQIPLADPTRAPARASDFWSGRAVATVHSDGSALDRRSVRYRLRWSSPVQVPFLEEKP